MNRRPVLAVAAGLVVFLGSALLFNVQPMTGRMLLPRFGGSATVWTACLVAFQLLLLAGYGYAAWISRLRAPLQAGLHLLLLALAAAWPGLSMLAAASIPDSVPPVLQVLLLAIAGTGPAYLLLAAGSTLVQSWLARARPDWNVYRLYALSNAGSMVGLFAYPFLLEPALSLPAQQTLWRILFGAYALLLAALAAGLRGNLTALPENDQLNKQAGHVSSPPDSPFLPRWWLLPLLAAFLLTAVTASLTQDITPIPMVWCLLLGAFLLSYVIGFSTAGETRISLWGLLAVCFLAAFGLMRWQGWGGLPLFLFLGTGIVLFGGLFLCGLLYASRPPAGRLPAYYLAIAAGGAAGGLLAGVAAPLVAKGVYEYALIAVILAVLVAFHTLKHRKRRDPIDVWFTALTALAVVILEPLCVGSVATQSIWQERNFYGVLRVTDSEVSSKYGDELGRLHSLVHGSTVHGFQALTATLRDQPTGYYGHYAGGYPIRRQRTLHPGKPLRVGVVGLGAGTLAVYGREGDEFRFYEINPQVAAAARDPKLFTFLADCAARVDLSMGDARLSLERERVRGEAPWDVLVVDAFSGDSVPLHLLTREAVALFLARVGPEGTAAFHISNRSIDLLPLLKAAARDQGVRFFAWQNRAGKNPMETDSRWVLLTRAADPFEPEGTMIPIPDERIPSFPVMTDQAGSILPLIDWRGKRMNRYVMDDAGQVLRP